MEPSAGRGRPLLAASRRAAFSLSERLSGRAVQGSLAASHSRRLGVSGRHLSPVAAPGSRFCKSGSRALRSPIKLSVRGALRPCASACLSAGISPSSQGALLLRWLLPAPPVGAPSRRPGVARPALSCAWTRVAVPGKWGWERSGRLARLQAGAGGVCNPRRRCTQASQGLETPSWARFQQEGPLAAW